MISDSRFGEAFAKRSAWRVLGVLLEPPFVGHQQTELSSRLGLPASSVQRGLKALLKADLVQQKRKQYYLSVGQDAVRYLWLLRQVERRSSLPKELSNALSVIVARDFSPADCIILFGSWARGVAVPVESDVDVAVFTKTKMEETQRRFFEGSYHFDLRIASHEQLSRPSDSAALDALLNGIPLTQRDGMYDVLLELRSFPKAFLIYRLRQAEEQLLRADVSGTGTEAARFFAGTAERAVIQVRSILEHGRTASWRELPPETDLRQSIDELDTRLAREGERIWLT